MMSQETHPRIETPGQEPEEQPPSPPQQKRQRKAPPPLDIRRPIPTFGWDVGCKYVFNKQTQSYEPAKLTLLDILYPTDEVSMGESPTHSLWATWLAVMLTTVLGPLGWLVLRDVLIHWGRKGIPKQSPDITLIPTATLPDERKSYRVGRDGPLPVFVIELTSAKTRRTDFEFKVINYAALGVREMLLIDLLPEDKGPWRLYGYRLGKNPFYDELIPDAAGGLVFETIGIRFVAVGRERIDLFHRS